MFYIEALGFGRGLGALDLSSKKFGEGFRLIDPAQFSNASKAKILEAFRKLQHRERLNLAAELSAPDRIAFEKTLYEELGILPYYPKVEQALKQLYKIRFAVND